MQTRCHKRAPKVVRHTCSWGALCDWERNLHLNNAKTKKNQQPTKLPCSGCILTTFCHKFILLFWSATDFNMTLVEVILILRPTYNLILNKKQIYLRWYHCSKTIWFYAVFCKKQKISLLPFCCWNGTFGSLYCGKKNFNWEEDWPHFISELIYLVA